MSGAVVKWNDSIEGYQIDVSIRFELGPYQYLHIVECKDHRRRINRDTMWAFAGKVEATRANKGTFISAAGFQSGAKKLAETKSIETFTLKEIPEDWPDSVMAALPTPFPGIRRLLIKQTGQANFREVSDHAAPSMLANARILVETDQTKTLQEIFRPFVPSDWRSRAGIWTIQVDCEGRWLEFASMRFRIDALQADFQTITGPRLVRTKLPPEMRPSKLVFENVKTGSSSSLPTKNVPFGFDTVIEENHFYIDVEGREYFCESLKGDDAVFVLLASRQFGRKTFGEAHFSVAEAGGHYVEISDAADLLRLQKLLADWKRAKREKRVISHGFIPDPKSGSVLIDSRMFESSGNTNPQASIWAETVNIEMELGLPSGERERLYAIDGRSHDQRTLTKYGLRDLAIIPQLIEGDDAQILINVFDLAVDAARPLVTLPVKVGHAFINIPTKHGLTLRVVRLHKG
jgi:hypothetical protein